MIATQIVDKKADSGLALKENQGTLPEDVAVFVSERQAEDFTRSRDCRFRRADAARRMAPSHPTALAVIPSSLAECAAAAPQDSFRCKALVAGPWITVPSRPNRDP